MFFQSPHNRYHHIAQPNNILFFLFMFFQPALTNLLEQLKEALNTTLTLLHRVEKGNILVNCCLFTHPAYFNIGEVNINPIFTFIAFSFGFGKNDADERSRSSNYSPIKTTQKAKKRAPKELNGLTVSVLGAYVPPILHLRCHITYC